MTSVARREHDDSGEFSDASQDIEQNNSGNDGGQHESDYDSQGSDSERSDRDPETQETERRVDDDEDRSNPQYIPKRGTFYEHDDRTAASGEESSNTTSETTSEKKEGSETPSERRRPPRKSDVINKWSHDKYNENEQMPKSRDELVAIYGYDIRNEDAPPHARRNRRYGRGPNKYTRTWEDEEAYKRQTAAQAPPRKPPNPDEFPDLDAASNKYRRGRGPRPRSKSQPTSNESLENGSNLRRNASIKSPKGNRTERPSRANVGKAPVKAAPRPQPPPLTKEKMPPIENLTITASVNNNNQGQAQRKVNAAVAQQRPVPTDQGKKKPPPQTQQQQPSNTPANKSPPQQPPLHKPQPPQQQNQQNHQPAGAEARGGSKRYSSLRQRPLAETYSPQPQQQQQQQQSQQPQQQQQQMRYAEYPAGVHQGSPAPHPPPQQVMHQVHRPGAVQQVPQVQQVQQVPQVQQVQQVQQVPQVQQVQQVQAAHGPSPPHQQLPQPQHTQQVRLGLLEQQALVPHAHALHNLPQPHNIGQLQATQGYAPPAMMPAQYMQVSNPGPGGGSGGVPASVAGVAGVAGVGGVFPGPMFAQPPGPYPLFPHHNYATQAGGVTYYNCAEQEPPAPVPRTQRRPTAAIPIVRPQPPERPANSSEIDRIVENMFVRKPWPATHGNDSKEKSSDNRSSQEPPSKESSQPNSLTSSSISTDSRPSEQKEERSEEREEDKKQERDRDSQEAEVQDSIPGEA